MVWKEIEAKRYLKSDKKKLKGNKINDKY